jgi:dihydromonapterin reductase/dihydrofolate reductase
MTNDSPIIITGGAQRLGLACAKHFNSVGKQVIITYRTHRPSVVELEASGIVAVQADFSTERGITDFIEWVKHNLTSIRAIIHNASDWSAESPDVLPSETLNRMMQVHVSAPYQINLALKHLLLADSGKSDIIHMTDYIQDTGSKKHIAYAASKAALHNLTLSFSQLLAPDVKVNSVAPALLMFNQHDSAEYKQKALKKSLLEVSPGEQEGVAAIDYLLNSQFITGRTLHLDGGRHLK